MSASLFSLFLNSNSLSTQKLVSKPAVSFRLFRMFFLYCFYHIVWTTGFPLDVFLNSKIVYEIRRSSRLSNWATLQVTDCFCLYFIQREHLSTTVHINHFWNLLLCMKDKAQIRHYSFASKHIYKEIYNCSLHILTVCVQICMYK